MVGLTCLFGYAFFKFGCPTALHYCSILVGAIPMMHETKEDRAAAVKAAERAVRMNVVAAKHFNAGLRTIFLSIGYLGWFVSPYALMALTAFVIFVLIRRQFFSEARDALDDRDRIMTLAFAAARPVSSGWDVCAASPFSPMASYHFSWISSISAIFQPARRQRAVRLYARAIASTFLMLAGFGLVLGHTPRSAGVLCDPACQDRGCGAGHHHCHLCSLPDSYIFFGILHAIAAASLIGPLFLRLPIAVTLIVALCRLSRADYLRGPAFDHPALLWLGLPQTLPRSTTMSRMLPWLAPFLIGIVLAKLLPPLRPAFDRTRGRSIPPQHRPVRSPGPGGTACRST